MAAPGRSESFLDSFFKETGISIDWALGESIWRTAGRAFQAYAARRRKHPDAGPRRILADFLIGAHALEGGHSLLTLDDHLFRTAFPHLPLVKVELPVGPSGALKVQGLNTALSTRKYEPSRVTSVRR